MEDSGISWCDNTHNEWIGCAKLSPACAHCYAEFATPTRVMRAKGLEVWGQAGSTPRHLTAEGNRRKPFAWDRRAAKSGVPESVFCSSLSDVFEDHPALPPWRDALFQTIEATVNLRWLLLTKRTGNVRRFAPAHWLRRWPTHVAVGATVEDARWGVPRIEELRGVDAPMRFVSVEPQLERLAGLAKRLEGIAWVINGGERDTCAGKARPFQLEWAFENLDAAREAGSSFHFKQAGDLAYLGGERFHTVAPHGTDVREMPERLHVQEFPAWLKAATSCA